MSKKKRGAKARQRHRDWWARLTPEVRAKVKQQQAARNAQPIDFDHHHRDDLACPACGTDSSVGCIAKAP